MIYVIDAIMGAGKTTAAINFMNEHKDDRRFLYITPYLDETVRIQEACPGLRFARPSRKNEDTGFKKSNDLIRLLAERRNIATTHELYTRCKCDALDEIARGGYTVIIDEVVDVFRKPEDAPCDIKIAVDSKLIVPDPDRSDDNFTFYKRSNDEYNGRLFRWLLNTADTCKLVERNGAPVEERYLCWMLDRELFLSSVETYVMTYLFEGSPMSAYFKLNGFSYEKLGVIKTPDGTRRFSKNYTTDGAMPDVRDHIEIVEHDKMNAIGSTEGALSKTWYIHQPKANSADSVLAAGKVDGVDKLRKNVINYYKHIAKCPAEQRMWCTFKDSVSRIRDKGFYNCYTSWNLRATNEYIEKTALAFLVNVFIDPSLKKFFDAYDVSIDYDKYSLSALVQWIWRSAIRAGGKVTLYLPSSRMRRLLNAWMDDLESGGDGSGFTNKDVELAS